MADYIPAVPDDELEDEAALPQPLMSVSNDLVDEQGRRWITMSNALIRSGQSLTLSEKRLVSLAISKLNPKKQLGPFEVPISKITATEYAKEFGISANAAYEQLQAASHNLYSRSIRFFEPAYKRKGKKLEVIEVNMRWVGAAHYHEKEGWIELHWWPKVLPHLIGLKKQFTQYQLQQASALRSIYSWRLLELLMRFEGTSWAEYSIEDFATSMDATDKQKADFGKLRTKIIEPAVKELTEKDGWIIKWNPVKAGRKVKAIRFEFERDPQQRLL